MRRTRIPRQAHIERHFTATETVRDIVIGMSDGLTVPFNGAERFQPMEFDRWSALRRRTVAAQQQRFAVGLCALHRCERHRTFWVTLSNCLFQL